MFWDQVLIAEESYLQVIEERLRDLSEQAQRTGHQDLKSIYAGGKMAFDKAQQALESLRANIKVLSDSGSKGQLPSQLQRFASTSSPARNRTICHAMSVLQCVKRRPSDVFRSEMRRQAWAFMERTHSLLQDQSIPDSELEAYIEGIGEMLCGIDLVESASIEMPEQSKVKSWVPAVLKAGVVAVATWKARDMWEAR